MNEKIRCIVVDDEPLAMELIASYVRKIPFLELIGAYDNSLEAITAIKESKPDLLFLDIQMPELNGLELARLIGDTDTLVVFVTAFEQYALEGFRVNAVDYLLKPVSFAEFMNAAQKAKKQFDLINMSGMAARQVSAVQPHSSPRAGNVNNGADDFVFVKTEYKLVKIVFADILYIEGLKDYIKIYLEGELHPVVSRMSMKSMEDILPEKDFIRVHRSFIVRKDKIKVIERGRIVFAKEYIPVSDSYKDLFNQFLNSKGIE